MDRTDRKQARADWLDRDMDAGIYALRFRDRVFLGAAPRLGAAGNRLRFTLAQGLEKNPALAAAWADEGSFAFEIVESLDPKLSAMTRQRLLKERLAHWLAVMGAEAV